MKIEKTSIRGKEHIVGYSEDELKEIVSMFKNRLSKEQLKILKSNVYTLDNDKEKSLYHGAGAGFVDIDKDGNMSNLKYINDSIFEEYVDDEEFDMLELFDDEEYEERYSKFINAKGQSEQNASCMNFDDIHLKPKILENGDMRLLVNFSSYQLCRF